MRLAASPATTGDFLQIEGLGKTYPKSSTPAVADVSLSVGQGEFLALLGPSGCGKTTTLRMLAGLVEPTAGRVVVGGEDITHRPVHKRSIGMVFQAYALFPHLDVRANVAYGLKMRRVPKAEIAQRVTAALDSVRLGHLADRRVQALSGGQQQRVALARAIVVEPALFLMDEPLSNLDAKLRDAMRREIRDIQRRMGITAVFVTHDQDEALTMADRIAVMSDGALEQFGTPTEIYERPASRFVAEFVGSANLLAGAVAKAGVLDAPGVGALAVPEGAEGTGTAMLRPHQLHVHAGEPVAGELTGLVRSAVYHGDMLRYEIEVGAQLLTVQTVAGAAVPVAVGSPAAVGVSSSHVHLIAEGPA